MNNKIPIELTQIKRTHPLLLANMANHYSNPKGFVGRNICYLVKFNGVNYGTIVGGSSTLHLQGRDEYFGLTKENKKEKLNSIINNIFFHIEKVDGEYPARWFSKLVIESFRYKVSKDWEMKYKDCPIGFETLVELPRTGECYKKDGWDLVGQTKGYTCKRIAGKGSDDWSGKRVWDTHNLRPKLVFCKTIHNG